MILASEVSLLPSCLRLATKVFTLLRNKAKLQYFVKMSGLSSKKAWRELNQVLGHKGSNGIEVVQTPNDRLPDRQSIVNEFNKYISSWSRISGADNVNTDHHFTMLPVDSRFTFERVEEEEILELLGSWIRIRQLDWTALAARCLKCLLSLSVMA